jgi:hypothetical protein
MPPPDMVPALAAGQIAGYIVAESFNAAAEVNQVGKVLRLTGDVWKDHACCVVFMHEHDLNDRPEWSQKVVNAMVKAQLWTRENRAETAQLLSSAHEQKYTPSQCRDPQPRADACRRRRRGLCRIGRHQAPGMARPAHRLPALSLRQLHGRTRAAVEGNASRRRARIPRCPSPELLILAYCLVDAGADFVDNLRDEVA